jgi:hypothetical protein
MFASSGYLKALSWAPVMLATVDELPIERHTDGPNA